MDCMLCGRLARPRFSHGTFRLWWCSDCEFGRLEGQFTPDDVASFYPTDYYTHLTHRTNDQKMAAISIAERVLLHAAWRLDRGQDLSPDELERFIA